MCKLNLCLKLALVVATTFACQAHADEITYANNIIVLPEVEVTERADSQIGLADSASQGNVGQAQLKYRPISRPGEILETVPGLIASQHSGEGKANQYYLRGFNLDHGTDFLTQIDGVPVNMTSHSHGQGWTDTNFLIPELIKTLSYKKGNYDAAAGDFSSTGSANIQYFNELPEHSIKFTGGSFDYYRGLVTGSQAAGAGQLLYAAETVHNDGPWTVANDYQKFNGVLRYSEERGDTHWNITAMAYQADWKSTDQIPQRAVNSGLLNRFASIDPTDGGASQRYSLSGDWQRQQACRYLVKDFETSLSQNRLANATTIMPQPSCGTRPDPTRGSGRRSTMTLRPFVMPAMSPSTVAIATTFGDTSGTRASGDYSTPVSQRRKQASANSWLTGFTANCGCFPISPIF